MKVEIIVKLPPRGILNNPEKLKRIIENTLTNQAQLMKTKFETTTVTWEHKPKFIIDKEPMKRTVYTEDEIYAWVSDGTEGHYIAPRGAKPGRFYRTGFRPKSRVGSLASNKGAKATKDLTFYSSAFWHPGTKARKFDETIAKMWKKYKYFEIEFQKAIDAEA